MPGGVWEKRKIEKCSTSRNFGNGRKMGLVSMASVKMI
jgi:hypothetical protein